MSELRFEVIDSPAGLGELADSWRTLNRTWMSPLLDFKWILAAAESFYPEGGLFVVVGRRASTVVAVAPLALGKRDGVQWIEFIGARSLYEASGFLYRHQPDLDGLLRFVCSLKHPVAFERGAFGSFLDGRWPKPLSHFGLFPRIARIPVPRMSLSGAWEDFFASQSAQRRYDHRRSQRRMAEKGRVSVGFHRPCPENAGQLLEEAFVIEDRSWKHHSGSSILQSGAMQDFFSRIGSAYAADGELVVGLLRIGETPVAMQIGLVREQRYWTLKIGFDDAWKRCSPGTFLMTEAIRMSFEQGLEGVEFLGSRESWLAHWADGSHQLHNLFYIPFSRDGLRAAATLIWRACRT